MMLAPIFKVLGGCAGLFGLLLVSCTTSEIIGGTGGAPASSSGGGPAGSAGGASVGGGGGTPESSGGQSGGGAGGRPSGGTGGTPSGGRDAVGGAENSSGGSGGGGSAVGGAAGGSGGAFPAGDSATVVGRELYLGGQPFRIRGVNWNPVPKGGTHPADLDFAGFADEDIALMQAAGINAVRTYERLENVEVLDQLHAAGIYVFSTVYGYWQDDPSVVTARVNAVKDHPAILAWVLGNEWNYNQLYANGQITTEQARDRINQAAALIKQADETHLVATIYGELGGLAEMLAAMPLIDVWGINTYRGISHGDLFSAFAALSEKPMFLGEYGADAYNANIGAVDLTSQAQATRALTEELIDNYATPTGGVTLGGFVFEFADEWWKDGAGSAAVQDVGGIAPGGGPFPDQTFNEEYWGLVDIDRSPRPAYEELKQLYAPAADGQ